MNNLINDIKYGLRQLRKNPGFTTIIVLTLALGIGANTAIFSVIYGVLLKPLPFKDAYQLCMIWETFLGANRRGSVSYPNFASWKTRNEKFASFGGFFPVNHTLTGLGEPERVLGGRITSGFFPTLQVTPILGRNFTPVDDMVNAENVAIVTYKFWKRRFGGDPGLIGQTLTIDNVVFTVVGILPQDFYFGVGLEETEIWTPTAVDSVCFDQRGWPRLRIIGRLKPGATLAQGQAQMNDIQRWLEEEYPDTSKDHGIRVVPLHKEIVGHVRPVLLLLFGSVGLVLLTACANVANLLLARGTLRMKELAVRAAVGAGRWRLVRQLLTESVIFGVLGGILGVLIAHWILGPLVSLIPPGLPRIGHIRIDMGVLLFTAIVSMMTSLIFGLVPAFHSTGVDMNTSLKDGARTSSYTSRHRLRSVLVSLQVALSLMLLVGAGLLIRSLHRLTMVDLGFNARNLLTFQIHLGWDHPSDSIMRENLYRDILDRIASLPGVESASAGSSLPLGRREGFSFAIEGRPKPPDRKRPVAFYASITEDYFKTLRIPLIKGRLFTEQDRRRNRIGALVINQTMARRFWPGEEPIGQIIHSVINIDNIDPEQYEVVGVVGDVHTFGQAVPVEPQMYASYRQQTFPYMDFVVHASCDPASLAGPIRKKVATVTQEEAVFRFQTYDEILAGSIQGRRFPTVLLGIFAVVALVLAGMGVYSMLCFTVAQRTHEIGIRMSLGAQSPDMLLMIIKRGMKLVLLGLVGGLVGSLATSHFLSKFLFEITPLDPMTYLGVSFLLILLALVACYIPARRAARIDPLDALRYE